MGKGIEFEKGNPVNEVRAIESEIIAIRRAIHRRPELGNREYETAELVERTLRDLGIETRRVLDTAVLGLLRGGSAAPDAAINGAGSAFAPDAGALRAPASGGPFDTATATGQPPAGGRERVAAVPCGTAPHIPTVALRADMDALPLTETTNADFASEIPGAMHACGHDVHMAAALGAAKILARHRDELPGNILFIFQPDEEGRGGAERLIRSGCLDGVDAIFGAHVSPDLPDGHVGIRYGKFYAASNTFRIDITGRSSHGAEREKGIDALAAAARMTTELLALPALVTDDRCVLTVGRLTSGTAENILPGTACMEGIIRTLGPETRAAMRTEFYKTVERIAAGTGVTADITYKSSYPGVVNDDAMTALAGKAMVNILGPDKVHRLTEPTMTTEDFGYYLEQVPGSFYHIGAGCSLPLHNTGFLPTDEALLTAAAAHLAVISAYFDAATNAARSTD